MIICDKNILVTVMSYSLKKGGLPVKKTKSLDKGDKVESGPADSYPADDKTPPKINNQICKKCSSRRNPICLFCDNALRGAVT